LKNKVVGSPGNFARSHAGWLFYSTNKERKQEFFAPKMPILRFAPFGERAALQRREKDAPANIFLAPQARAQPYSCGTAAPAVLGGRTAL
jgi:hypothetical protein